MNILKPIFLTYVIDLLGVGSWFLFRNGALEQNGVREVWVMVIALAVIGNYGLALLVLSLFHSLIDSPFALIGFLFTFRLVWSVVCWFGAKALLSRMSLCKAFLASYSVSLVVSYAAFAAAWMLMPPFGPP